MHAVELDSEGRVQRFGEVACAEWPNFPFIAVGLRRIVYDLSDLDNFLCLLCGCDFYKGRIGLVSLKKRRY